jgi:quercetin dioxygenase-like cupin family protein
MLNFTITETEKIDPLFYDWGALKWLANAELASGCQQSFGLVHIMPGRTNPLHWHTTAEELVYVLSGECDITIEGAWRRLTPGLTLHIPSGARHQLTNNGWEPFIYVASFSASMRGTLFEEPTAVGAQPIASYR